jgi:excisionase family DNA binding protein
MSERRTIQQTAGSQSLMTAHEVADLLQVSLRTVRRLIADGRLPVVRIGRSVRISREAFEGLLTGRAGR